MFLFKKKEEKKPEPPKPEEPNEEKTVHGLMLQLANLE
jgi:hypothetical protein